jgi:FkbM family methyltransferase
MGRVQVVCKEWLQKLFNLTGYRLERLATTEQPIDVFDLAVRKTALERGNSFFFVQIGANDGLAADPIRQYVEKYSWAGLLVEPLPNVFERLKRNYAGQNRLRFVNAAVSAQNGRQKLYTVAMDGDSTLMASFRRDTLAKAVPAGTTISEIEVPTMRLDELLVTHDVADIDLLQIDVEGYDFEVIKMVDFARWRPSIIHYEHYHLSNADRQACQAYLHERGYRIQSAGIDTTAILPE